MFGYSKSKVDQVRNGAAGRLLGLASNRWGTFGELYQYLISDISSNVMNKLFEQFLTQEEAKGVKNRRKLKQIGTAYESGYQYPKWILTVLYCLMFLCFSQSLKILSSFFVPFVLK